MSKSPEELMESMETYRAQPGAIPRDEVLEWLDSDNLEIMCTVHDLLSSRESDIVPPLEPEIWMPHYLSMIRRCIIENHDGAQMYLFSDLLTRCDAAHDLWGWFRYNWRRKKEVPEKWFIEVRAFLEDLAMNGDKPIRDAIECGMLEHLFDIKEIREFFSGWNDNPKLASMYRNACAASVYFAKLNRHLTREE